MRDVIVVGAGPAGSTAARIMAARGLDVLVFERERFPRIKPCGGGLTSRALALLPEPYQHQLIAEPIEWTFEGRGPNGRSCSVVTTEPYSHIVTRPQFDQWLAGCAESAGATIHFGEAVTAITPRDGGYEVRTDHDVHSARYLVGADGGRGISARQLGFSRPQNGAALEVEIPVSDALYQRWQERVTISIAEYPWGYAWVIPRRPILNLGICSFRANKLPLQRLLHAWVQSKLGPEAPKHLTPLAHPLPYRHRAAALSKERALLIGDAAGLMDTLSAEGIYSALESGTLAAESIIEAQPEDAGLSNYDRRLKQQIWPSLHAAAKLSLLFYPLPGFWSTLFTADPALVEQYLFVAQGRSPYSSLLAMGQQALLRRAHVSWRR